MNLINPEEQNENGLSPELGKEKPELTSEKVNDSLVNNETAEEKDSSDSPNEMSFNEVLLERDEFLNLLQSVKADFDNYKKQTKKRITETVN